MTYPKRGFPLLSYSGDGIETIDPSLGRGLDSWGLRTTTPVPLLELETKNM